MARRHKGTRVIDKRPLLDKALVKVGFEVHGRTNGASKWEKRKARGYEVGIVKACDFLKYESQLIVPVDTGKLKASGKTIVRRNGFDTTGRVSYDTDYAVIVHEDLLAQHAPGKQAKYLEAPAREKRFIMKAMVVESMRRA